MAQFWGTIKGARGEASRLGHKASGLDTYAASWQGAVSVRLWHDAKTGRDMAQVELTAHHGAGVHRSLYRGPVSGATCECTDAGCKTHRDVSECSQPVYERQAHGEPAPSREDCIVSPAVRPAVSRGRQQTIDAPACESGWCR